MIFNSAATVPMRVLARATRDKRASNIAMGCVEGVGQVSNARDKSW